MWRLMTPGDSEKDSHLYSSNGFLGRQVWKYDAKAGTLTERQEVERIRGEFVATRHLQVNSSDRLFRHQKHATLQVSKPASNTCQDLSHKSPNCTV
jgi:hypothetical protein